MLDRSAWAGPGPTAPRPERRGELTHPGNGPSGAACGPRARRNVERTEQMEAEATKLQEAAYGAQLAAGLRVSDLATAVLISADGTIHHRSCAAYIHALQCSDWYAVAFTGYTGPVTVAGDCGPDRQLREPTRGRESSKGHHHARGGSTSCSWCGGRWETKPCTLPTEEETSPPCRRPPTAPTPSYDPPANAPAPS